MFKLRSQTKSSVANELKPSLGDRSWNDLNSDEIYQIWKHMESNFFDKDIKRRGGTFDALRYEYDFFCDEDGKLALVNTIKSIYHNYKVKNFTPTFLEVKNINSVCKDFYDIFCQKDEDIVLEMLSIYSKELISLQPKRNIYQSNYETEDEFKNAKNEIKYSRLDNFSQMLNSVFADFGIYVILTREGFIPRQEDLIIQEIYTPVIGCLSVGNFKEVERELSDALDDYRKKDYSGTITKCFSCLQAYLQILVHGGIGKGEFGELKKASIKKGLIPDDIFTNTIFRDIESIMARERIDKGDPHPKIEYATESGAKLILNLTMIFLQYYQQNK